MKKNDGFVATILIYSTLIFSILLTTYIIYGINNASKISNYIEKSMFDKLNDRDTFKSVIRKLREE